MTLDSPKQRQGPSLPTQFIVLACLAALTALIFYVYHLGGWRESLEAYKYFFEFKRLRIFIASFGPFAAGVFVVVQSLQVVFAPVPGEITGFVGGLLFGKICGTIYSTIGLTLGSVLAFAIARRFGASFVHRIVKKEYIDRFDHFVTHRGLYIAFILFLIPGFPKDSLCYLLGLTRLRFLDFLMMNLFGRLPGTLMLGFQGDAVRNRDYLAFWILLAASVLLFAAMYVARNHCIAAFSHVWAYFRPKSKADSWKKKAGSPQHENPHIRRRPQGATSFQPQAGPPPRKPEPEAGDRSPEGPS